MRILSAFFLLLLLTVTSTVSVMFIGAQRMDILSSITANSDDYPLLSAGIDTRADREAIYFGTSAPEGASFSSYIVKYDIANGRFNWAASVPADAGPTNFEAVLMDEDEDCLYAAVRRQHDDRSWVCRFSINPLAETGCESTSPYPPPGGGFISGVMDKSTGFLTVGTENGKICRFRTPSAGGFACEGCIALSADLGAVQTMVIDGDNSHWYAGGSKNKICKAQVNDPAYNDCIDGPSPSNSYFTVVMDWSNQRTYWGTTAGAVCVLSISVFASVQCLPSSYTGTFSTSIIDVTGLFAYFATNEHPSRIFKVNVNPSAFQIDNYITAPTDGNNFVASVLLPTPSSSPQGFFASQSSENGLLVKVCLPRALCGPGFTCPGCTNIPCPEGFYQDQTGADSCKKCTVGHRCESQQMSTPTDCTQGFYQDELQQTTCKPCLRGHSCPATAMSSPLPCELSTFQSEHQQEKCDICTKGGYCDEQALVFPKKCDRYHWSNTTGANSSSTCRVCPHGFRTNITGGAPEIEYCDQTLSQSFSETQSSSITISESPSVSSSFTNSESISYSLSATDNLSDSLSLTVSQSQSASSSLSTSVSSSATGSSSLSPSSTQSTSFSSSLSTSVSPSVTATSTESHTNSRTQSLSESMSTSLTASDSIYCSNFDEQMCSTLSGPLGQCHYCPRISLCLPVQQKCDECLDLDSHYCLMTPKGTCNYCPEHDICVNATTTESCACVSFSQDACDLASFTCNYCASQSVCVPTQQPCGCINFTSTISFNNSDAYCSASPHCRFCPEQQTCLPKETNCTCHDMNPEQCAVSFLSPLNSTCKFCSEIHICAPKPVECLCMSFLNQSVCEISVGCHWCSNYSSCAPKDIWSDCDCASLETSDYCDIISSNNCQWCGKENQCADPSYKCECERFTESMCTTSSCFWCGGLQSCTVPENRKCECYYLRSEDRCSDNSNSKCSWCGSGNAPVGIAGSRTFPAIGEFNYCIDKATDQCECSYLSPEFCNFSSSLPQTSSAITTNFSTSCKYCPNLQLCTHPSNAECFCGDEFSYQGCLRSPVCSWKKEVLTIEEAVPYCGLNLAAVCDPVACEGIRDVPSCKASGCNYNVEADRCEATACFNFFVKGFSPQPYMLYFFGLFKDAVVVLLVGALGDYLTRPVMNIVIRIKSRLKNWKHIKHNIKNTTIYVSDRICRDNYSFSFSEYVERICEDTFEFVDDDGNTQVLDEEHRLKLFDITAFCLFDNMLWIEPQIEVSEEANAEPRINNDKNKDNDDAKVLHQEMKTLPSFQREKAVEIDDADHHRHGENNHNPPQKREKGTSVEQQLNYSPRENGDDNNNNQRQTLLDRFENDVNNFEVSAVEVSNRRFPIVLGDDDLPVQHQQQQQEQPSAAAYTPPNVVAAAEDNIQRMTTDNNTVEREEGVSLSANSIAIDDNNKGPQKHQHPIHSHGLIQLKTCDFDSLAGLRNKVKDTLIAFSCENVYYAQSRSFLVSACAAINSFPTAIQLLYYTIAVGALYIAALYAVFDTPKIDRLVAGCNQQDAGTNNNNNNATTVIGGGNETIEEPIDFTSPTMLVGMYLLLGFRLMNSSVQATSALIFVKTMRGIYQRFSGLYDLTLQQRIPLMGLYADRPVQITLAVYAFFILPFAVGGPVHGIFFISWRCFVPIAIGIAIILLDAGVLYFARWYTIRKRLQKDQEKVKLLLEGSMSPSSSTASPQDENVLDESLLSGGGSGAEVRAKPFNLSPSQLMGFEDEFEQLIEDEHPVASLNVRNLRRRGASAKGTADLSLQSSPASSPQKPNRRKSHKKKQMDQTNTNNGTNEENVYDDETGKNDPAEHSTVRSGGRKGSNAEGETGNNNESNDKNEEKSSAKNNSSSDNDEDSDEEQLDDFLDEKVAAQTSITSSAPVTLGKAIIVFMLTEEIPTLAIALALQVSMNYLCLLKFSYAFGIRDNFELVHEKDYDGRRLQCIWDSFKEDASAVMSGMSSFVPFM